DEPTSALADQEVQTLFGVIRQLKEEGIAVVFVSHRLDELYAVCDQVTIMRDGRTIEQRPLAELSRYELVAKMLGRELAQELSHRRTAPQKATTEVPPALAARGLRRDPELRDVALDVRHGALVDITGLP